MRSILAWISELDHLNIEDDKLVQGVTEMADSQAFATYHVNGKFLWVWLDTPELRVKLEYEGDQERVRLDFSFSNPRRPKIIMQAALGVSPAEEWCLRESDYTIAGNPGPQTLIEVQSKDNCIPFPELNTTTFLAAC